MNDPATQQINIEEQREWLNSHKAATGDSWSVLAGRIGIKQGTLSVFGGNTYAGDNQKIAEEIYRYRQLLTAQQSIDIDAPEVPSFFETDTSVELGNMLRWAQRGRIVVAALGPGLGKTITARQYKAAYSNVFLATMSPSTAGVNTMQVEVLEALGEKNAVGTPQRLSRQIRARVENLNKPLIIIDEAQHLSEKAVEEIRSWNDATGVGIALFGNASVLQRLEGGTRREAFAQIYSRVALKLVRRIPLISDIDALARAWRIEDTASIDYLRKIGQLPGGLRGTTMALELASMLAAARAEPLNCNHLQDAWGQLSSRAVAA